VRVWTGVAHLGDGVIARLRAKWRSFDTIQVLWFNVFVGEGKARNQRGNQAH